MLVSCQAYGETVFIRADDKQGRGITYAQCSQCLIITPAHVAGELRDIRIIGKNNKATRGRDYINLMADEDASVQVDLAILKVKDENFCFPESIRVQVTRCRQQHFIDLLAAITAELYWFFGNDCGNSPMTEG